MNKPIVTYLGHSGFSVETDKYFLIFDYIERYEYEEEGDIVEQVRVDFDSIKKPIIMFQSHWHYDHYNKAFHEKLANNTNITTILGDIKSNLPRTYTLKPRQCLKLDDIEIHTAKSTDTGVCYLIKVDGLVIYFAGDHIDWGDDDPNNEYYWEEIDYLNSLADHVDYAFIPVCTFYGEEKERITNSALYAIEKMKPLETYPMHSSTTTKPYYAFAEIVRNKAIKTKVVLPK